MLPKTLGIAERLQLARDAGFTQVECPTTPSLAEAQEIKAGAAKAGLRIHSVMNSAHWQNPFSSPDPAVVQKGIEGAKISIQNAKFWGADTVLLVPAVVDAKTSYADAYTRSQHAIRQLIPIAAENRIILAIEEVWNKFLLSPLEFARYIDEFKSPWVRAYFDVGNVVLYGYPQDWITTLGHRIVKLHIKDFAFKNDPVTHHRVATWTALREGEIDWQAIYAALAKIGYRGTATVELEGGDGAYLKEVNRRFEMILSGTA